VRMQGNALKNSARNEWGWHHLCCQLSTLLKMQQNRRRVGLKTGNRLGLSDLHRASNSAVRGNAYRGQTCPTVSTAVPTRTCVLMGSRSWSSNMHMRGCIATASQNSR
jgi:hypothetical protein